MNELPMWWLVLSALFFLTNVLLFAGIAFALFKLGKTVQDMKPKIEQLVTKVDGVTTKVDTLATTLQETVRNVGDKASGVAGSASSLANTTTKVFEKYAPALAIVMTGLRVLGALRDYRAARKPDVVVKLQDNQS